jgi:hypothetical protein
VAWRCWSSAGRSWAALLENLSIISEMCENTHQIRAANSKNGTIKPRTQTKNELTEVSGVLTKPKHVELHRETGDTSLKPVTADVTEFDDKQHTLTSDQHSPCARIQSTDVTPRRLDRCGVAGARCGNPAALLGQNLWLKQPMIHVRMRQTTDHRSPTDNQRRLARSTNTSAHTVCREQ